jgi:O-antigen/teichoic acid export membrane protein
LTKQALPFVIGYGLFAIYYRIDVLMLSIYQGDTPVGIYSAAYKLTDPLLFIPGALASTLMPIMSKQYLGDKEKLNSTYLLSTKYILALMLPVFFGIYLLSEDIITFLYGSEFSGSVTALQILSFTIIFNSLNSIQSSLLTSANRQEFTTFSIGICCVLNIVLNMILIPNYSYIGASFATLVSVIILFSMQFYFIYLKFSLHFVNKNLFKPFIASGVMGLALVELPNLNLFNLNLFISIFIGMIIYLISVYLLKIFSKEDIRLFQK